MGDVRREYRLLSNHKHQLQNEGGIGIEKGKKSKETDNQQCCLFCCVSVVFYLLVCLIYGSLYDEGVLQIHGCYLELPLHIFTQDLPCSFIVSFIVQSLLGHITETSLSQSVGHYMKPIESCKSRSQSAQELLKFNNRLTCSFSGEQKRH